MCADTTIKNAYNRIQPILDGKVESLDSVELVDAYRQYFKPEKVKIVLLAESHVFTSDTEREIRIPPDRTLPNYPNQYARFVYCLGYGEKELTQDLKHPAQGTPQFWKVFYSCCHPVQDNSDFSPILRRTVFEDRVRNKIELLLDMKARGIWLIDASIVALYGDNLFLGRAVKETLIKISWDLHARGVVLGAAPDYVICIGRAVANVVEPDLQREFQGKYKIIAQPNARLSNAEHMKNYKDYFDICSIVAPKVL